MTAQSDAKIAVIGLGYVGLPLAVEFAKKFSTKGFDRNTHRIEELRTGKDSTLEVEEHEFTMVKDLLFTANPEDLADCNFFIIAVPTPIDSAKRPDLKYLLSASATVGSLLKKGDYVVYESTVYPGATEETCIPVLEKASGLRFNIDFFCGYSPERINPGDKEHRLPDIVKITSGSTPEAADYIDQIYSTIITAGTFKATSIKVAEAAKVIENTQRDVNIALVNELSLIFNKLSINTAEVLQAAGTKWNFLPFYPGLVGGHCIGVDPYYLTHKAQQVGYHPDMILAGRRLNDDMGSYIAARVIKLMINKGIDVSKARVLMMGITFKENCPDLRNTKVIDIVNELHEYGIDVSVYDPWVNKKEAQEEYDVKIVTKPEPNTYDGIVLAVAHSQFCSMSIDDLNKLCKDEHVIFDVKNILPTNLTDGRL
jgi:UDP-N-acetyl-D-glucosamine/UDP-N-acetyl-D-galactosamine dehydrogenase